MLAQLSTVITSYVTMYLGIISHIQSCVLYPFVAGRCLGHFYHTGFNKLRISLNSKFFNSESWCCYALHFPNFFFASKQTSFLLKCGAVASSIHFSTKICQYSFPFIRVCFVLFFYFASSVTYCFSWSDNKFGPRYCF